MLAENSYQTYLKQFFESTSIQAQPSVLISDVNSINAKGIVSVCDTANELLLSKKNVCNKRINNCINE